MAKSISSVKGPIGEGKNVSCEGEGERRLIVAGDWLVQVGLDEGFELGAQVRGDSGFEAGDIAVVIAFDHLTDGVETRDDVGGVVWDCEFDEVTDRAQEIGEGFEERVEALACGGADSDAMRVIIEVALDEPWGLDAINFIEDGEGGFIGGADFLEDSADGGALVFDLGVTDVDDVNEEIGGDDFFESGFESLDELVRKFADEPDGI
jgi:hypothetical protein